MRIAIWRPIAMGLAASFLLWCCGDDPDPGGAGDLAGDFGQPDGDLPDDDAVAHPEIIIPFGDGARLFEVVNDPSYAGYRVVLEPGSYALDRDLDPADLGYLRLQPGMEIVGSNGYRDYQDFRGDPTPDGVWDPWDRSLDSEQYPDPSTETIIDCSLALPASEHVEDCNEPPRWTYVIPSCVSLGSGNRLSRVTVRGSRGSFDNGQVGFEPWLRQQPFEPTDPAWAEISDCLIDRGLDGIRAGLWGCSTEGVEADVTIHRNIIRGCEGAGLFLVNLYTRDVSLRVTADSNRLADNAFGFIAYAGVTADRCHLDIESSGTIIRENSTAEGLLSGLVDYPYVTPYVGGNDNTLAWTSRGDWIVGNGGPVGGEYGAGG